MRVTYLTHTVLGDVETERHRQHQKHGDADNPLSRGPDTARLACLAEEFGEVSKEVCEGELFGNDTDAALYKELIQTAAVAVAHAETMRRDGRIK